MTTKNFNLGYWLLSLLKVDLGQLWHAEEKKLISSPCTQVGENINIF